VRAKRSGKTGESGSKGGWSAEIGLVNVERMRRGEDEEKGGCAGESVNETTVRSSEGNMPIGR